MRTIKIFGIIVAALVFVSVGSVGARANLLVDGGFDQPTNPVTPATFGFYANYGPINGDPNYGGVSFDNSWVITGNVDLVENVPNKAGMGWTPVSTPYSLDLNGNTNGNPPDAIAQTITTKVGQQYSLSFYYSNNSYGSPQPADATVTINGSTVANVSHGGATPSDMNWMVKTVTFTALTDSTTVMFTETDTSPCCNGGVALDNVNISAIPEPATWGMMILGFMGIGFVAYRRKNNHSFRFA